MAKVEKILEMVQLVKEDPDISVKELSNLLNMNLRTVYRYTKQLQQIGLIAGLKEKNQLPIYDELAHLNLAFSQPQLSVLHKLAEAILQLQNTQELKLSEPERQALEQAKDLISKALWVKPEAEAAPASINFLFEPTKGRYDGEVSLGFVGNFEIEIPLYLFSSISVNFLWLIFSTLFTYSKGKPEGLLVNSWEVSDDLLTWSFDLKEGIRFHNGSELTAEDVEFTYRSKVDPEYRSQLAPLYSYVKSFEAISRYKFQVRLKQPYIALLDVLGVPILPKGVLQRYRQLKSADPEDLLIGSGPFKFDSFSQNDTMTLKANEDYFEEGYPHLERMILKAYPTSRDLFNAAASGEVDLVIFGLMISEFEQLSKTIPFQVYPLDMHAYYALLFNQKNKILSDIRVRKAISHAIDRESLIKRQLRGYGNASNGPLPPASWAYNENLQPVKYDIELARSLLVEAGWQEKENHWQNGKEELEIEIAVAREVPDLVRLAIGLKIQLSKLKVKVKLRYINSSQLAPNAFESAVLLINCGEDPDVVLWRFWHSGARFNFGSYQNPEVDDMLEWGRNITSMSRRKLIYDRIQELIVADHPAAFLCTSVCLLGSNCVLQNASEFLTLPDLFLSVKSWTIKRGDKNEV